MLTFAKIVAVPLALYLLALLYLYGNQRHIQYLPGHFSHGPSSVGLHNVETVELTTPDSEKIILWYAKAPEGRPTILFFHGNSGEIGHRAARFQYLQDHGFGVAFLSYRGFGPSTGQPSEDGLMRDATTAYDWLRGQKIAPDKIFLIGESLGTGVAVQLASRYPVGAIALEAPYTSIPDVAARSYWWLPVYWLMKDQFRSSEYIAHISAPLLVISGGQDRMVPPDLSEQIYRLAPEPKEQVYFANETHELIFHEPTWAEEVTFFNHYANP